VGGSIAAAAGTLHTVWNLRQLRVPPRQPDVVTEAVSVLLPLRNEATRVTPCLRALLAQERMRDLEILVLDDCSTDDTAALVGSMAGDDPRVRLLAGTPLPPGWLGKPYACHQLAAAARGRVLVFVDADVVLQPLGLASTVSLLRASCLDLVSPYPRQLADGIGPRLVQPLLQWSWLTTLPLGIAERSKRRLLAAANGQFLAVDAAAYRGAGGHAQVRGEVLEDVALLRAIKSTGGAGVVVDGTAVAACRMYDDWRELRDGYTKSLWSAFGSPAGAAALSAGLLTAYVAPALAALRGSRIGLGGYLAGAAGRALVAHRVGGRVLPDSLLHPVSVATLVLLTADSWRRRRRGTLTWRGRPIPKPREPRRGAPYRWSM
jgi:hypothetical protein